MATQIKHQNEEHVLRVPEISTTPSGLVLLLFLQPRYMAGSHLHFLLTLLVKVLFIYLLVCRNGVTWTWFVRHNTPWAGVVT